MIFERHLLFVARVVIGLLFAGLLLNLTGCQLGSEAIELLPVSGEVRIDGKPLTGAKVVFVPRNKELGNRFAMSYAVTDDQGKFTLKLSDDRKGAYQGWHYVLISKRKVDAEAAAGDPDSEDFLVTEVDLSRFVNDELDDVPMYYNSQTELTFEVRPGNQNAKFELSSIDPLLK